MKKLTTLLLAFLVTAGMAFAQNNEAKIDQVGDNILGDVYQEGNSNTATIDQENLDVTFQVIGFIEQIGRNNTAIQNQTSNASNNNRRGFADFEQLGNDNYAYLNQGDWGGDAVFKQHGHDNWIGVRQQGNYDNIAEINQYGDNNKVAYVYESNGQLSFNEGTTALNHRSQIWITQDGITGGIGNRVGFHQNGWNTADITQIGDNNEVLLYQQHVGNQGNHDATVVQDGFDNHASIYQISQ